MSKRVVSNMLEDIISVYEKKGDGSELYFKLRDWAQELAPKDLVELKKVLQDWIIGNTSPRTTMAIYLAIDLKLIELREVLEKYRIKVLSDQSDSSDDIRLWLVDKALRSFDNNSSQETISDEESDEPTALDILEAAWEGHPEDKDGGYRLHKHLLELAQKIKQKDNKGLMLALEQWIDGYPSPKTVYAIELIGDLMLVELLWLLDERRKDVLAGKFGQYKKNRLWLLDKVINKLLENK